MTGSRDGGDATTYDVCIVGGGTAGLPLGEILAKRGLKVVVLEQGTRAETAFDPGIVNENGTNYRAAWNGWVRALGGSSRIWGGRMVEIEPREFPPRPELGFPGWPIESSELERRTPEVEELFGLPPGAFRQPPRGVLGDAATAAEADRDVLIRIPVIAGRAERNMMRSFDGRSPPPSNLDLRLDSALTGFHLSNETGQFILSAGALESTRLLLWLNRQNEGRLFGPSQRLGRTLVDHLAHPAGKVVKYDPNTLAALLGMHSHDGARHVVHFELSHEAQRRETLPSAYLNFQVYFRDEALFQRVRTIAIHAAPLDMLVGFAKRPLDFFHMSRMAAWQILKTRGGSPSALEVCAQVVLEQVPGIEPAMTLTERTDRNGVPIAQIRWAATAKDIDNATRTQAILQRFWDGNPISKSVRVKWDETPARFERLRDMYHPCGLIPMGADAGSHVVGPDLAVHAVPNLSVLSLATFPSAGCGNPTMALMQLMFRLADRLAAGTARIEVPVKAQAAA
jgi:choline dehydrogenase-like flavoprotein